MGFWEGEGEREGEVVKFGINEFRHFNRYIERSRRLFYPLFLKNPRIFFFAFRFILS